jgi:hypothetical protein
MSLEMKFARDLAFQSGMPAKCPIPPNFLPDLVPFDARLKQLPNPFPPQ